MANLIADFDINKGINKAFYILSDNNQMLYDYWINELYDDNDDPDFSKWNADALYRMSQDLLSTVSFEDLVSSINN
jgi:hypothetical protein